MALHLARGLILLGDKDHLRRWKAGQRIGDLCARAEGGFYTQATRDCWSYQWSVPGRPICRLGDQACASLEQQNRDARSPIDLAQTQRYWGSWRAQVNGGEAEPSQKPACRRAGSRYSPAARQRRTDGRFKKPGVPGQ